MSNFPHEETKSTGGLTAGSPSKTLPSLFRGPLKSARREKLRTRGSEFFLKHAFITQVFECPLPGGREDYANAS